MNTPITEGGVSEAWFDRTGGQAVQEMTVRDEFAMAAMQGFLSSCTPDFVREHLVRESYILADKMMEGRK